VKKLIILLIVLLLVVPIPSIASSLCDNFAFLAKTVMAVRQQGITPQKFMATLDAAESQEGREITNILIFYAYQYPVYETVDLRLKVIMDFGDIANKSCLKQYIET
jgi:hypothetical protein